MRPPSYPTGVIRTLLALVVTAMTMLGAAAPAAAQEATFSVAVSVKEAVEALGRRFMQAHPGVTLRYNFGSSGELSKQIEAGRASATVHIGSTPFLGISVATAANQGTAGAVVSGVVSGSPAESNG